MRGHSPRWRTWLRRPVFCFRFTLRAFAKNFDTFIENLKSKENRHIAIAKIKRIVKNHGYVITIGLLTYQNWSNLKERHYAEGIAAMAKVRYEKQAGIANVLRRELGAKSNNMNALRLPWYKKIKRDTSFVLVGINQDYENFYNLDRFESLGETNIDIAGPIVGEIWRQGDLGVVKAWQTQDLIEYVKLTDSSAKPVFSRKWPERDGNDTIVYGFSFPVDFLDSIKKQGADKN